METTTSNHLWLPVILIGVSGLGIYWYGTTLTKARNTVHWSPAAGYVTRSEVVYDPTISKANRYFQYAYTVDGQEFVGKRVTWGNVSTSGTSLFQPGQQVTVYVNPENSQEAVLQTGMDRWTWVQLGVSSAIHLLGWWTVLCLFSSQQAPDC
ncbi:MAG: DUF3592 domain-containing protein [Cyanobacteria bacterium P01_D01_bin.156]